MTTTYYDKHIMSEGNGQAGNGKATVVLHAGKRQRDIRNSMRGDAATPLTALRRRVRGPRWQPPGTITTDPKDVDETIRATHGEIYAGNVKEGKVKTMVDDYMEKYKKYIYKSKEYAMEDITAEDVQEEIRTLKEITGGVELLPITSCERLAQMFNAIEKGASWQNQSWWQEQPSWPRRKG